MREINYYLQYQMVYRQGFSDSILIPNIGNNIIGGNKNRTFIVLAKTKITFLVEIMTDPHI